MSYFKYFFEVLSFAIHRQGFFFKSYMYLFGVCTCAYLCRLEDNWRDWFSPSTM